MHHSEPCPFTLERNCFGPVNSFRAIISFKKLDFENIKFQDAAADSLQKSGLIKTLDLNALAKNLHLQKESFEFSAQLWRYCSLNFGNIRFQGAAADFLQVSV